MSELEKQPGEEYANWKAPETGENRNTELNEEKSNIESKLKKIDEQLQTAYNKDMHMVGGAYSSEVFRYIKNDVEDSLSVDVTSAKVNIANETIKLLDRSVGILNGHEDRSLEVKNNQDRVHKAEQVLADYLLSKIKQSGKPELVIQAEAIANSGEAKRALKIAELGAKAEGWKDEFKKFGSRGGYLAG